MFHRMVEKKFFDEKGDEGPGEIMYRMERDLKGDRLHITGEEWEKILPQGEYFKFTFVRHPFERYFYVVSRNE